MKSILILGAGIYQVPLIKKARDMGLKTIVASINGNYPGFSLADKVYYVDTRDADALYEIAKKEEISGVITTGTDVAVASVGSINDRMGLKGCSYEAGRLACDKQLMKDAFICHGVPTAQYRMVSIQESDDRIDEICREIGYPVIFKVLDSSGSRGVTVVRSRNDIGKALDSAKTVTKKTSYIIEKYLEGFEFGAQAFIQDGKVEFVLPHGDYVFKGDTGVPIGHFAPIDKDFKDDVTAVAVSAINALGIDNCAINLDFICSDEKVYALEIGARCGATQLAELVSLYYGFDYYEKMLEVAIGETAEFPCEGEKTPNASHLLMSDNDGVIKSISSDADKCPGVVEVCFDYSVGDRVSKFHVGPDRIGHVITKGRTLKEAQDLLDNAMKHIQIMVEGNEA